MVTRQEAIAELQRRGIKIAQPVSSLGFTREDALAELQRRGVQQEPPQDIGQLEAFGKGVVRGLGSRVRGFQQLGTDIGQAIGGDVSEDQRVLAEREALAQQQFEAGPGQLLGGKAGQFIGDVAPFIAIPGAGATLPVRAGIAGLSAAAEALTRAEEGEKSLAERAKEASVSGVIGAAGSAALEKAIGLGKRAIETIPSVPSTIRGALAGAQADEALAKIVSRSKKTPSQLERELVEGEVLTIADIAGDEVQGIVRSVGKTPIAKDIVNDALNNRSTAATERVINSLSKRVSNVDTYFGNLDDIVKSRAVMSKPLYEKAFDEAPEIVSDRLETLLADRRVADAVDLAKSNYGVRVEAPRNSLETLDGVKKVLWDRASAARRSGEDILASEFDKLRRNLVSVLDDASPTYKQARKVFEGFSQLKSAQEAGLQALRQTPEQLRRFVAGLSPGELDAFKIGIRSSLENTAAKTPVGSDPAKRLFGTTFKRNQLKAIFGDGDNFKAFEKEMLDEIKAASTKQRILGGSRTDINLYSDLDFLNEIPRVARGGSFFGSIGDLTQAGVDALKRRYTGINDKNAKAIAEALTDRDKGISFLQRMQIRMPQKTKAQIQQKELLDKFISDATRVTAPGVATEFAISESRD